MMNVPLSKPLIEDADIAAVVDVLKSGWLIHGPKNEEFERMFAAYIGTKHALTMNSCASALHVALIVNGIGKGDKVVIPSFTHSATANCVVTSGATPVFADVNMETFNIDTDDLERKITKDVKAVIVVHYAGSCCDMDEIMRIIKKHNLVLIEDVAESCGTSYKGRKLGSFGTGCFSFFPTKNMTTGEGGALTINIDSGYNDACCMVSHGVDKSTWAKPDPKCSWRRLQRTIGYNFRLTNFQAALGIEQLKKLDRMNENREKIAGMYTAHLKGFDCFRPQKIVEGCSPTYQMYTMLTVGIDRNVFLQKLKEKGVGAAVHFDPPVHLQPFYRDLLGEQKLPNTEVLSQSICTLPIYPNMTKQEVNYVLTSIDAVLKEMKTV
jgi:perosamine synthetase